MIGSTTPPATIEPISEASVRDGVRCAASHTLKRSSAAPMPQACSSTRVTRNPKPIESTAIAPARRASRRRRRSPDEALRTRPPTAPPAPLARRRGRGRPTQSARLPRSHDARRSAARHWLCFHLDHRGILLLASRTVSRRETFQPRIGLRSRDQAISMPLLLLLVLALTVGFVVGLVDVAIPADREAAAAAGARYRPQGRRDGREASEAARLPATPGSTRRRRPGLR